MSTTPLLCSQQPHLPPLSGKFEMMATSEARCLQRNLDRLSRTIDPVVVSTALFAAEIIDQRSWEDARREGIPHYDRCLNLLGAVMRSTEGKQSIFEEFCEILENESTTAGLARELRASLQSLEKEKDGSKSEAILDDKENLEDNKDSDEDSLPCKKKLVLMEGEVLEEKRLMDIAWEVGEKWEELGIALGLQYKVLQSAVGNQQGSKVHMKAFQTLQEWRQRLGDRATYPTLAKALEESGLVGCAQRHCYRATAKQ